jgi:3-phosphoshikimate 1-carboxyvinyltransferase
MSDLTVRGPARPLVGDVTVPGDKSVGHRSVIFGALASGRVRVRGLSGGEDNRRTVAALRGLGVAIADEGGGALTIDGVGLFGLRAPAEPLDCGNSGTSIRLLCGLLAGRPFSTRLFGDQYLQARPMRRVADPLKRMGGQVNGQPGKKPGELYPPLDVGAQARGSPAFASSRRWRAPRSSRRCCSPPSVPTVSPRSSSRRARAITRSGCCASSARRSPPTAAW